MRLLLILMLGCFLVSACDDSGGPGSADAGSNHQDADACKVDTSYAPEIDPASFVSVIDNPLLPWIPGTKFSYRAGVTGTEMVEVTVTSETKKILGVTCVVVHDVASVAGEVTEDTYDWYAQDKDGNVWYFGEDTKELEGGKVTTTEGSWEGGVDGAKPGIVMPASPEVGDTYRQEYSACNAEDMGMILALDASADVPAGSFTGCLKTRDFTPLEPDADEEKYYCPGKGNVLSVDLTTGEREELLMIEPP